MATVNLPINPSAVSGEVGKDFLLYINTGSATKPIWTLIGGQRNSSLGRTAEEIDVSHKTSGGWGAKKAGMRAWSVDLEAIVVLSNVGLQYLEEAFMEGKEVNIRQEYPDNTYQEGWGSLTDYSQDTPHDAEATIKGTISGNGALSKRLPALTPLLASTTKVAAEDLYFTVEPAAAAIKYVKNDETPLKEADFEHADGVLTLKAEYLATLAVGLHLFNVGAELTRNNTTEIANLVVRVDLT